MSLKNDLNTDISDADFIDVNTPELSTKLLNNTKPKTYKKHSAKKWARVKLDWDSGQFTARALAKKHGLPLSTISSKICREKWSKGKDIEKLSGSIAVRNLERFARAGMARQDAINLVVEGMTKPESLIFEGKGENMLATPVPDYKTRLQYLQEYNKMVGNYAPMEKEVDKHLHFHVTERQLKEMTASEVINSYQQMQDQ